MIRSQSNKAHHTNEVNEAVKKLLIESGQQIKDLPSRFPSDCIEETPAEYYRGEVERPASFALILRKANQKYSFIALESSGNQRSSEANSGRSPNAQIPGSQI